MVKRIALVLVLPILALAGCTMRIPMIDPDMSLQIISNDYDQFVVQGDLTLNIATTSPMPKGTFEVEWSSTYTDAEIEWFSGEHVISNILWTVVWADLVDETIIFDLAASVDWNSSNNIDFLDRPPYDVVTRVAFIEITRPSP